MKKYNVDQFFNWLSKPMKEEDIKIWYMANNIIPELNDLFRDFCFSFYLLILDTYLGDSYMDYKETKIGMTHEDKLKHFEWCWNKTVDNFKKENIQFEFKNVDYDYFKSFFFEVFYEQEDIEFKMAIKDFLNDLFDLKKPISKSDLEMYTDVYKSLERSLQI